MSRAPTHLLYLHGFRSSPRSAKAVRLQSWIDAHRPDLHWWCPQLPPSPAQAMAMVRAELDRWPRDRFAVLGSSLGGFYATCVAEDFGCPAVLLNPAVNPARDLAAYIGEHTAYHDPTVRLAFRREYVDELTKLMPVALTQPERYLAVIAKGDELLDWREMADRYADCQLRVIEGSDHGMSDFDSQLPHILHFLKLNP